MTLNSDDELKRKLLNSDVDAILLHLIDSESSIIRTRVAPFPSRKAHKRIEGAQIALRVITIVTSLAACWIVVTSVHHVEILGMKFDAPPSYYSKAFDLFAFTNGCVCFGTLMSFITASVYYKRQGTCPTDVYDILAWNDVFNLMVALLGWAAAAATNDVGVHGNPEAGWAPACDKYGTFCERIITAELFSYVSIFTIMMMLVMAATNTKVIFFKV